ncbi:protein OSCP1 [Drosophila grimshawi]|uniref:GH21040 n=1 Tax=Drosophila grimshawi TaxID=7222 RepID=B4J5F7_DROGR|nr:protein OSCP1 [Drosophila grimshawi]EDW00720.1 GH21040 [Drosophila grimshawi]
MSTPRSQQLNPRANVFILVNLGCEALYVIDQRLKAQQISTEQCVQVIHDVTTVLLEPKFLESIINGSMHSNAQLLTADQCKFMVNDIATCSVMRLDELSMEKLWNLMTMVYKWQLFVSRHQHHLLDITIRHLDGISKLYPDAKRHMLIDFSKNTLLDFWNACGEEQQLSIYRSNKAWLQCFNVKISLLIRLGFQALDGSFLPVLDHGLYKDYVQCIGDNIFVISNKQQQQQQQQQREPNRMDQLAAQLSVGQTSSSAGEDLQAMDANQLQKQIEQTFSHILFPDFDNNAAAAAGATATTATSQVQRHSGCEFVQLSNVDEQQLANPPSRSAGTGSSLNQQLLDLYSKIN